MNNQQTMQNKLDLVPTLVAKFNCIMVMQINKRLNHLAVCTSLGYIKILELNNYQIIQQFSIGNCFVDRFIFQSNDSLLVVSFGYLFVFEYYDNYYHHNKTIKDSSFHKSTTLRNDIYLISVTGQNNLYILNYVTRERKIIDFPQYSQLYTIQMSQREDLLITGGKLGIYFFDLKTNRIKRKKSQQFIFNIQLSNNSQLYTEETYFSLRIRSIQQDKIVRKFISDSGQCSLCQKFTKNDAYLILTGIDQKVRVFNVIYGILEIYELNLKRIFCFVIQDDDNIEFICGTENGSVVKWSRI